MKKILSTNEINNIVTNTIKLLEDKKGTNTVPYIQMDLSVYSSDTLEAIKEAFIAAGIRFDDRWNNGSDFIVDVNVECAPRNFKVSRMDAGTFDPRNPMRDSVHVPKEPSHLGRRDSGTVDSRNPMHDSVHKSKISELDIQINEAKSKLKARPVNNGHTHEMKDR